MGKIKDTSTWILKEEEDNNTIATLELFIYPYGAIVKSVVINDEDKLPKKIKDALKNATGNITTKDIFQTFLDERKPDKKECEETDLWIMKQLELTKEALQRGRLTNFCGFISVINYFRSNKDSFYLCPTKQLLFYWGFIEKGFIKLYEINPKPIFSKELPY